MPVIAGLGLGHHTGSGTGVTVLLLPRGTVASGEVRGGAPATRELALLDPTRTVANADAFVLCGGSAFGLAAADGVMRFLAEQGRGFATAAGPVPIVPAAAIFDLVQAEGPPPGAAEGYAAAVAASRGFDPSTGRVGAGTGATVGKWKGASHASPGGLGVAEAKVGEAAVLAVAVVNALGDVIGPDGRVVAGTNAPEDAEAFPAPEPFNEQTTLVALVTDAQLDKVGCHLLAQSAHDGVAVALSPAHTRFDGDLALAAATGAVAGVHLDRLRMAAVDAVVAAIRSAVGHR